jgi:hypothetical protein
LFLSTVVILLKNFNATVAGFNCCFNTSDIQLNQLFLSVQ